MVRAHSVCKYICVSLAPNDVTLPSLLMNIHYVAISSQPSWDTFLMLYCPIRKHCYWQYEQFTTFIWLKRGIDTAHIGRVFCSRTWKKKMSQLGDTFLHNEFLIFQVKFKSLPHDIQPSDHSSFNVIQWRLFQYLSAQFITLSSSDFSLFLQTILAILALIEWKHSLQVQNYIIVDMKSLFDKSDFSLRHKSGNFSKEKKFPLFELRPHITWLWRDGIRREGDQCVTWLSK